ncbi:MAG TPA: alpha/beta hydrolase family protein [Kofleriaceae bacterium]|nr:alpha/beta hydrolase family protein [Kofleriaceae bacterium]
MTDLAVAGVPLDRMRSWGPAKISKRGLAVIRWCAIAASCLACAPPRSPAPLQGTVTIATLHSEALGVDKRVVVYLPAGYDRDPDRRWPVFYYLQGTTSEETEWVTYGMIDRAADALGLDAIIVMPDGDDAFYVDSPMAVDYAACLRDGTGLYDRHEDPPQTCVRAPRYETYVVRDVVDWVDATYRTINRRDGRAIAGLSMGGYGALMLAMRHPERFAAVASHSGLDALLYRGPHPYAPDAVELYDDPATYGNDNDRDDTYARLVFGNDIAFWRARDPALLAQTLAPGQLAIYLDCGAEDRLVDGARYLDAILTSHHLDHVFWTGPGKHDYELWRARLPVSLAFLRDHVARR